MTNQSPNLTTHAKENISIIFAGEWNADCIYIKASNRMYII